MYHNMQRIRRDYVVCAVILMTGVFAGRQVHALPPLFSENFEGLSLGPPDTETWPFPNAYTHTPPTGWFRTPDDPHGRPEWRGWSFSNKDFWIDVSPRQGREQFSLGKGIVAVADSNQWNEIGNPANESNFY